jgi:murein DD-endopeptidase MepM/ murein hydrolase activator NlpD
LRLIVSATGAAAAFAALAIAQASAPPVGYPGALQPAREQTHSTAVAATSVPVGQPAQSEPATVRITGTVGPDLTRSLEAAGVPEKQGREYVAVLFRTIDFNNGLSVADRFDLVILREEEGLGELAFAGLDRVGRADVQLMKWTDGKEIRWIDADRLDPSAEGMQMPVAGRVSSPFGERFHPVLHYRKMHNGVDLAARHGAPIVAAASGRAVFAGWRGGYGRQIAIEHADGVRTTYSHMSRMAAAPGADVRQGQVIGYVGSTGLSTGPHLHYEVYRNGRLVNPLTVKLTQSPLQGEELHAFKSRLRALLTVHGG